MKHQALFSSKDKSKKIKVSSAAILFGAIRVKIIFNSLTIYFLHSKVELGNAYKLLSCTTMIYTNFSEFSETLLCKI